MSPAPSNTGLDNKMPAGIPYIIWNEFAERFCYYGINAILAVYMTQHLHFGQAQATVWQSLFKFGAYFFPLIGAIVSDVFWGKYRTIMTLAMVYCAGCTVIALGSGPESLAAGLLLMAIGTGGIKPCVSTNVGDQFTEKNKHLIERGFSYFYLSINAGSSFSIYFCPVWLNSYGPRVAFGIPAIAMFIATVVFWLGRRKFVVVPPAMTKGAGKGLALFMLALLPVLGIAGWVFSAVGPDYRTLAALLTLLTLLVVVVAICLRPAVKQKLPAELRSWMEEAFTGDALKQITGLAIIYYVFIAVFWALWDQSNGQTFTLQATSDLMDKHLFGFLAAVPGLSALASYQILPSQIQVVNGLLILVMVPLFTFFIYPMMGRMFRLTPLRKIGIGMWVIAASFLPVALIENRIMHGEGVSVWWQMLSYVILTAAEVLISITALEFSYMQAPLKVKSFIMAATYLLAVSIGNAFTAQVNSAMVKPLPASAIAAGEQTWVTLQDTSRLRTGQKIDFDGDTGISVMNPGDAGGAAAGVNEKTSTSPALAHGAAPEQSPLNGTFLIGEIDEAAHRVRLLDAIHNQPVVSSGAFKADSTHVSTYKLVGPQYFLFFAAVAGGAAVLFIFVAGFYRERTHVRPADPAVGSVPQ